VTTPARLSRQEQRPEPRKKKSIRFTFDVSDLPPALVPFALRSADERMEMIEPVLAQVRLHG